MTALRKGSNKANRESGTLMWLGATGVRLLRMMQNTQS